MQRVGIIGLGPWGICALERIVTTARQECPGVELEVHVIEPGMPGAGVYDVTQPDYLLLNNPCGQLSLYPFAHEVDRPSYGMGLYDWAVARGYRWVDDRCVVGTRGEPIEPHHFLPRRLMGEYLNWFYRELVNDAPAGVEVVLHPTSAVDIHSRRTGQEHIFMADGTGVDVDHVIVTSGHTANRVPANSPAHTLSPYPVAPYVDMLPGEATVAVAGMGLVAIDVVMALTVGRGGAFVSDGSGGLRYRSSGREPSLQMYSRSGLPFTSKTVTGIDRTSVYEPVIATPAAFAELARRRRAVDVRTELLPIMFAEMSARYFAQRAYQLGGRDDAALVRASLQRAWSRRRFPIVQSRLAGRYGAFDPEALFFGHQPEYTCSADYEQFVYSALADDLREAEVPDGWSPTKCASEVFRIFRDPMRTVVEQGGLSLDSYLDFNADIRSRIHRLVAGPPALRFRQLLALMDAGILRMPYGPGPNMGPARTESGARRSRTRIASTAFTAPHSGEVDYVIRGYLDEPRVDASASELLSRLYDRGRVSQFRYGSVSVGSVDLTPDSHPIDQDGNVQSRMWVFGILTEGARHFTHYIPSPRSRIRAFEDLGACVSEILDAPGSARSGEGLVEILN